LTGGLKSDTVHTGRTDCRGLNIRHSLFLLRKERVKRFRAHSYYGW